METLKVEAIYTMGFKPPQHLGSEAAGRQISTALDNVSDSSIITLMLFAIVGAI